jgi:EmrB/QacA subfamily drug resistance transporter
MRGGYRTREIFSSHSSILNAAFNIVRPVHSTERRGATLVTTPDHHITGTAPRRRPPDRTNWVIATMCLAVMLAIAGVAGLTVAIPTIGAELAATQSELQWILDAFALTLAALLLPMGAIGDRFGRRRLMLIGFVVFVAASLWAAWAGSVSGLIAARALGGVGAAMVFPGTLATLTASMPDSRRGTAIGLWAASASLGGTFGALAAGGLVEVFWFGSVFLATAVAGAIVGAMTWWFVPETNDPDHANIDPVGSVLSLVGVGGLVLAITEGPVKGWTDPLTIAGFAAAALGLAGFTWWELRTDRPLLDVRLFRDRGFATGTISIFVQYIVVFGYFFVAAQYLAFVPGYGPFAIAAALLPVGILLPYASTKAPAWAVRHGRGRVGGLGLALMAAACAGFATFEADSSYWWFAAVLTLFGAGMGLAAPPATEAIVEALPPAKQGVASATNDVARELGGALGIAVLGSVLTAGYRAAVDVASAPPEFTGVARDSAPAGLQAAAGSGAEAPALVEVVQRAVLDGFTGAMTAAAVLLALGAVYVWRWAPTSDAPTMAAPDPAPVVR